MYYSVTSLVVVKAVGYNKDSYFLLVLNLKTTIVTASTALFGFSTAGCLKKQPLPVSLLLIALY